jgi:hypothetical protein
MGKGDKSGGLHQRHPERGRVIGVTLVYINLVVALFVISAFVSIDPSPGWYPPHSQPPRLSRTRKLPFHFTHPR